MFWLYVGWVVAALLAAGSFYMAYEVLSDDFGRDSMGYIVAALCVLCGLGILGGMYAIHAEQTSPILATLHKGYWACTDTVTTTTLMPIKSGDVTVMMPQEVTTCVQYNAL